MAGKSKFLEQIARAREATQPTRPEEKPVAEMNDSEMNEALRQARVEAIEANRAVAAAAAEYTRPDTTLGARLADLQRHKRKTWR